MSRNELLLNAVLVTIMCYFFGGFALMILLGVLAALPIAGVPALGYWTCFLIVVLLRTISQSLRPIPTPPDYNKSK